MYSINKIINSYYRSLTGDEAMDPRSNATSEISYVLKNELTGDVYIFDNIDDALTKQDELLSETVEGNI